MTFLDIVEGLRVGLNVCGTPNTKQQSGHCFVCLGKLRKALISLCAVIYAHVRPGDVWPLFLWLYNNQARAVFQCPIHHCDPQNSPFI